MCSRMGTITQQNLRLFERGRERTREGPASLRKTGRKIPKNAQATARKKEPVAAR